MQEFCRCKMLSSKVLPISLLCFSLLCLLEQTTCQFPSVCNNDDSLQRKVCCPNECNAATDRGSCVNVTAEAMRQAANADPDITEILANAPNAMYKGTIDSRYLWPTMVFESVCMCNGKFYGADCSECAFGWTGDNCQTRKPLVVRRSFSSLPESEKQKVVTGLQLLKSEMGYWSVVVSEPSTTSGQVTLQDVSTYDYLVYIHTYVSRDASEACQKVNGLNIDFAHSGPNFPVWHRTYLLIVEKEMQRVLNVSNFGFPYWNWENNDKSPFSPQYFGSLSLERGKIESVSDGFLANWRTVCDFTYRDGNYFTSESGEELCEDFWALCNPATDLDQNRKLERGKAEKYLPSVREIQMTIAAPKYDVATDVNGVPKYQQKSPRESFRSRLEGWSVLCSASNCIRPQITPKYQRMHNIVHDWVDGHMSVPPSAVNDPIFSLHHSNIDRILESWMKRFTLQSLPDYMPRENGHPGHNVDDYMVPFFPLITPGGQYSFTKNWGYRYDNLIRADISDRSIDDCKDFKEDRISECLICHANSSCYCSRFQRISGKDKLTYKACPDTCPADSAEARRCESSSTNPTTRPSGSSAHQLEGNQRLLLVVGFLITHVILPYCG